MTIRNIFFDLDGMKFDTLPALVYYINNTYGINTTEEEHRGGSNKLDAIIKKHVKDPRLTRDIIYKDFGQNFITSIELHKNVFPMENMCEVVYNLSQKGYTLWTVTARQRHGMNVIKYLLDKYIPNCIKGIHCVWGINEENNFVSISKKDFMQSIPGEKVAFFDDSVDEIEEVKNLIPSYLFDPTNTHEQIQGAGKVRSWKEIGDMFL